MSVRNIFKQIFFLYSLVVYKSANEARRRFLWNLYRLDTLRIYAISGKRNRPSLRWWFLGANEIFQLNPIKFMLLTFVIILVLYDTIKWSSLRYCVVFTYFDWFSNVKLICNVRNEYRNSIVNHRQSLFTYSIKTNRHKLLARWVYPATCFTLPLLFSSCYYLCSSNLNVLFNKINCNTHICGSECQVLKVHNNCLFFFSIAHCASILSSTTFMQYLSLN